MKELNFLLFFLFALASFAQSPLHITTDFSVSNVSISYALKKLAEKTEINIAFSDRFFDSKKKISYHTKKESIANILTELLKESDIGIKVLDSQIVLFKNPKKIKQKFTIFGYIEDLRSAERLISAAVYDELTQRGTITNEYGFFSLTLPEGEINLTVSYLGYGTYSQKIILKNNKKLLLGLEPSLTIPEIVVSPTTHGKLTNSSSESLINIAQIKSSPGLGGELDVLRTVQQLSGVASGADGLGGLFVRGGSSDQNLFLFDGVPVYNPSHLLGVFSVFPTKAIRNANFIKGNFPARYGGRISSVLDVRTRDGNQNKWSTELGLGFISADASVEGPVFGNKGAMLLTGRLTHNDFFLEPTSRKAFFDNEEGDTHYKFHDFNAKFNLSLSEKDRIYWNFYNGRDAFDGSAFDESDETPFTYDDFQNEINWGNIIHSFRWNHRFSNKLFLNSTLTYSRFTSNYYQFLDFGMGRGADEINNYIYFEYSSEIKDYSLFLDFDYHPSTTHQFRFGAGYINHFFKPGATYYDSRQDMNFNNDDNLNLSDFTEFYDAPELYADEIYFYIEHQYSANQKWKFDFGLRSSGFYQGEKLYLFPEPRLALNYRLSEKLELFVSVDRMVQYLHLISPSNLSLPQDVWIPPTDDIPPQDAWQAEVGINYTNSLGMEMLASLYRKEMSNLLGYNTVNSNFSIGNETELESSTFSGNGNSYGFEYFIKKKMGNSVGQMAYTLSWSNRQFEEINLGKQYAFEFDRRHSIALQFFHNFNKNINLSANWIYGSASPQLRIATDDIFVEPQTIDENEGERNELRSKANHRLDLCMNWQFTEAKLKHKLSFSVYNLYNHKNIAFHKLSLDENQQLYFEPISLFSRMPSISYNLIF